MTSCEISIGTSLTFEGHGWGTLFSACYNCILCLCTKLMGNRKEEGHRICVLEISSLSVAGFEVLVVFVCLVFVLVFLPRVIRC